jgi:uncharacterized membrane protein YcaP (DUF421 family)
VRPFIACHGIPWEIYLLTKELALMWFSMLAGTQALGDMFFLTSPVLEKVLRSVIVYVFLVVLLRVFGKRELAQLNPFDLVVLLSLSNAVQNAIIGADNSISGGLISAFTLLAANYLVIRFLFKHRRLDQILEGKPTTLIEHGQMKKKELAKELLSVPELLNALHRQGFARLSEVERCVLEPGGTFFVQRKEPSSSDQHQSELLSRLDQISQQVEALRQQLASR